MAKPFTNSPVGNALAKTLVPAAAAVSKAMAPKPAALPTMEQHADALHPVASAAVPTYVSTTPNRVTGEFSK